MNSREPCKPGDHLFDGPRVQVGHGEWNCTCSICGISERLAHGRRLRLEAEAEAAKRLEPDLPEGWEADGRCVRQMHGFDILSVVFVDSHGRLIHVDPAGRAITDNFGIPVSVARHVLGLPPVKSVEPPDIIGSGSAGALMSETAQRHERLRERANAIAYSSQHGEGDAVVEFARGFLEAIGQREAAECERDDLRDKLAEARSDIDSTRIAIRKAINRLDIALGDTDPIGDYDPDEFPGIEAMQILNAILDTTETETP